MASTDKTPLDVEELANRELHPDDWVWITPEERDAMVAALARERELTEALDEAHTAVHGQAVDDALAYVETRDLEVLDPHDPLLVLAATVKEVRAVLNSEEPQGGWFGSPR